MVNREQSGEVSVPHLLVSPGQVVVLLGQVVEVEENSENAI